MKAMRLALILGVLGLLAMVAACGGDSPQQVSENASLEGITWVLETMHEEPVVDGSFVWLRLDGDEYEGVDGCNNYGGVNQHGVPVVGDEGEFNPPPAAWTAMLCKAPHGVMEQADEYRRLLGRQGQTLRVEGDRLEILDWSGKMGLVFVRQAPLAGHPVDLVGTAWRILPEDGAGEDAGAATLVFLDEGNATGVAACSGYVAAYKVSGERLNVHSRGMTEYGRLECEGEARRQEGQFGEGLSRAVEYSVSEEDGARRLRFRTSRGRTLAFEPLDTGAERLFGPEWHLTTVLYTDQGPDRSLAQRTDNLVPGTEVTARFYAGGGMSGFSGCNSYGVRLEPEEPFARGDGTFANGTMAIESNLQGCVSGIQEQEERFQGLISSFERYRIYGELLVVHTDEDVVLLFQER